MKREEAFRILEILQKEEIDVSNIMPEKRVEIDGEVKYEFILLRDIADERIDEIIEKYNLDSNFQIGKQIDKMMNNVKEFSDEDKKRVEKLGIEKVRRRNYEVDKDRDEALRILELLDKEGADVSSLSPKRKINGKKVFRILKELRVNNIDEIIEKYNLDPEFRIGYRINEMRHHPENYDGASKKRIEALGIKKQEKTQAKYQIGGVFRNQIEEALYVLEKLNESGIDTAYIKWFKNGKYTELKDIECPDIQKLLKDLGLDPEYPISRKVAVIRLEYQQNRGEYRFGDKERERVDKLGLFNIGETNAFQTVDVLEKLNEAGIDLSSIDEPIVDKDGNERGRFLCEIDDPNINQVIEQLGLPKYYMISKRLEHAKQSHYVGMSEDKIKEVKDRLRALGLQRKEVEPIDIHFAINLVEELKNNGVNIYKIPMHKGTESRTTLLSDVKLENSENLCEQFNITEEYHIGRAIEAIINSHRNNGYYNEEELSEEEKEKVKDFYIEWEKEKEKTVSKDTIRLIERLQDYNIDVTNMSLTCYENNKQRSLLLSDLALTEEELEKICNEFELEPNFRIGQRIINIISAIRKGNIHIAVDDEDKRIFGKWGMTKYKERNAQRFNSKKRKIPRNLEIFKAIKGAGIDLSNFTCETKINDKYMITSFGMLDISEDKRTAIMEKFEEIDGSFLLGSRYSQLRASYKNGKMTEEEKIIAEDLGIISELDKLEIEQKELEGKLEEIKILKSKAKSAQRDTKVKSVGDANE